MGTPFAFVTKETLTNRQGCGQVAGGVESGGADLIRLHRPSVSGRSL